MRLFCIQFKIPPTPDCEKPRVKFCENDGAFVLGGGAAAVPSMLIGLTDILLVSLLDVLNGDSA
jgi:hypothetical protein